MSNGIGHRLGIVLVGAALVVSVAACEKGKAAAPAAAPPPAPEVVVAQVEERPVDIYREFTARTEAVPTVEVRARISGVLEKVMFKEGSEVKEGQTLFVIQQDEYKAALQTARAQLAKAQADLTRAKDASVMERARAQLAEKQADHDKAKKDVARYQPLAAVRAIPQQDLDTSVAAEKAASAAVDTYAAQLKDTELVQRTQIQLSEAAVESAKASIIQAELNLGYTEIKSPITGIIGKVNVDVGNLVGKADPTLLATVSKVDPIYVDFPVSEGDYIRLASRVQLDPQGRPRGERAPLELFLTDDKPLPQKGQVVFVERAVDPKTGTIGVRAAFPNPNHIIRPGQFARVRGVIEQRPQAVLAPQIAVQDQQGAKIVFVVGADDKVAMRPVTLDERIGDAYIVKSGLKAGERVIVEGTQKVRPGMQVKAVPKSNATPPAPKADARPEANRG